MQDPVFTGRNTVKLIQKNAKKQDYHYLYKQFRSVLGWHSAGKEFENLAVRGNVLLI